MTAVANARDLLTRNLRQSGIYVAFVAIVLLFTILTDGLLLDPRNLTNLVLQYSYILILAIGMVLVIIAGHIDLSVGSVAAFVGIVTAILMREGMPWPLAVVAAIFLGMLVGAWQGFWVAKILVPAFIVTLSGMLIFRGANQWVGSSATVPVPEEFKKIGAGYIPQIGPTFILPGGTKIVNTPTLILGVIGVLAVLYLELRGRSKAKSIGAEVGPAWGMWLKVVLIGAVLMFFAFKFATGNPGTGFPISGVILIFLVMAYSFLMNSTVFGRHVYAIGGNKKAAQLSGVKVDRVTFLVMANMSMLAALAGVIFISRAGASGPQDGLNWELDAISAVFIGGAAVTGGVGTVMGSIIGGLVMAFLNNGLSLMGVGQDKISVIKGLVLLAAVAFDLLSKKQGKPSIIGWVTGGRKKKDVEQNQVPAQ